MSLRRVAARFAATALIPLTAVAIAACGDFEGGDGDDSRGELTAGTTTTREVNREPARDLPERPSGVVEIRGQVDGSVTDEVARAFPAFAERGGLAVRTETTDTTEADGFEALCEGRIDIAATSRLISEAELEACEENGLAVVDFRIAFDAIVVATRNERDVGADCVNLAQLRAMYGAGSPVNSWNQLNPNFGVLRILPAGPTDDKESFDFFGARVLGVPNPTLANFRSDYQAASLDNQVKNIVVKKPPGAVGIVGFSFYELFEEKLRPLEIDGQTGDRCVFPSEETISSELYPLGRTLRLYTTVRSLRRPEVQAYIQFELRRAADVAADNQLIPLSDQLLEAELAKIEDPEAAAEQSAQDRAERQGTTTETEATETTEGETTASGEDGGDDTTTTTTTGEGE